MHQCVETVVPGDPARAAAASATDIRVKELETELASKQAKIDSLMLEYCPDEMTPEQVATWARHQRVHVATDPHNVNLEAASDLSGLIAPVAAAEHPPESLESLIETHRIGITPEHEGGFHAAVYGDSETIQAEAFAATAREAVDAVLSKTRNGAGG